MANEFAYKNAHFLREFNLAGIAFEESDCVFKTVMDSDLFCPPYGSWILFYSIDMIGSCIQSHKCQNYQSCSNICNRIAFFDNAPDCLGVFLHSFFVEEQFSVYRGMRVKVFDFRK